MFYCVRLPSLRSGNCSDSSIFLYHLFNDEQHRCFAFALQSVQSPTLAVLLNASSHRTVHIWGGQQIRHNNNTTHTQTGSSIPAFIMWHAAATGHVTGNDLTCGVSL